MMRAVNFFLNNYLPHVNSSAPSAQSERPSHVLRESIQDPSPHINSNSLHFVILSSQFCSSLPSLQSFCPSHLLSKAIQASPHKNWFAVQIIPGIMEYRDISINTQHLFPLFDNYFQNGKRWTF